MCPRLTPAAFGGASCPAAGMENAATRRKTDTIIDFITDTLLGSPLKIKLCACTGPPRLGDARTIIPAMPITRRDFLVRAAYASGASFATMHSLRAETPELWQLGIVQA